MSLAGQVSALAARIATEVNALVRKSTVTTKGDLLVGLGAASVGRLGVGGDGQVLTADSTLGAGIKWATPAAGGGGAVAIAALCASTANLSLSGLAAIDGVTPAAGDVVLVKDQTLPAANGVYVAASGAWTRHASWDTAGEVAAAGSIRVLAGATQGGSTWDTSFKSTDTLGTTPMVWAQAYSDLNPPGTLELTETPAPSVSVPVNGQAVLYTPDGVALRMKGDDGITRPATSPAAQMLPVGTGVYRANMTMQAGLVGTLASNVSGRMTLVRFWLEAGEVVTNLAFMSGSTAAATPTHWWFALYDGNLGLIRQTADQLTAAWAASALKTLPLTAAYAATTSGWYYAAVMVAATTMPTFMGVSGSGPANGLGTMPLSGTSTTGLTTTAPATAAALTVIGTVPLVLIS